MTTPTPEQQSREIFFAGIGHFEAGRLDEARDCFERCRALTPERPSVLGNLGITLFRLGRTREALPLLQRATVGEPQFTEAWTCLGLTHEAHGEWAPAVAALTQALALSDGSAALWNSLGQCQSRLGHGDAALQALERALALDATIAAAWSLRGSLLRERGALDAAAHSFDRAIALGADRELHAYYLASVRTGPTPPPASAPRQYVQALFDDYAADFQQHLVDELDYRGHELLLRPLIERRAGGQRWRRVLDLGCGTGLCAPLLRPHCDAIDGVDLSGEMLKQAARLGLYRELVQADVGEFLSSARVEQPGDIDLIVAADVLIYVGEPTLVFREVARLLTPGGLFAFTVELPPQGDEDTDLVLLPSLRYAHSERSVRGLAAQCGLQVDDARAAPIRHEQGKPVPGLYVALRR